MYQRGIRGAITVKDNTIDAVKEAAIELMNNIIEKNKIEETQISHIIYTLTSDIDCVYPAKIVREAYPNWKYVPMMCVSEMAIKNSLSKCLRVLIVVNTECAQNEIQHVYLRGAEKLRNDLK